MKGICDEVDAAEESEDFKKDNVEKSLMEFLSKREKREEFAKKLFEIILCREEFVAEYDSSMILTLVEDWIKTLPERMVVDAERILTAYSAKITTVKKGADRKAWLVYEKEISQAVIEEQGELIDAYDGMIDSHREVFRYWNQKDVYSYIARRDFIFRMPFRWFLSAQRLRFMNSLIKREIEIGRYFIERYKFMKERPEETHIQVCEKSGCSTCASILHYPMDFNYRTPEELHLLKCKGCKKCVEILKEFG